MTRSPFLLLCLLTFNFSSSLSLPNPSTVRSDKCPVKLPDRPSAPDVTPPQQILSAFRSQSSNSTLSTSSARQPRIINGDRISRNLQRSLVFLVIPFSSFKASSCTGTLISPRWVLTAAHCQANLETRVYVGISSTSEANRIPPIRVEKVINHPRFAYGNPFRQKYDISAIKLAEEPNNAQPMRVNVDPSHPRPNQFVRVAGYGASRGLDNNNDPTDRPNERGFLRQVDIPVSTEQQCASNNQFSLAKIDNSLQVCAGYPTGQCDSCLGDSGGPLIRYEGTEPIVSGITSFGIKCAVPGFPGVYVRTASFEEFLDENDVEFNQTSGGLSIGTIVGVAVGALVAISLLLVLFVVMRRKRARPSIAPQPTTMPQQAYLSPGGDGQFPPLGPAQIDSPPSGSLELSAAHSVQTSPLQGPYVPPVAPPGVPQVPVPMYTTAYGSSPHNEQGDGTQMLGGYGYSGLIPTTRDDSAGLQADAGLGATPQASTGVPVYSPPQESHSSAYSPTPFSPQWTENPSMYPDSIVPPPPTPPPPPPPPGPPPSRPA